MLKNFILIYFDITFVEHTFNSSLKLDFHRPGSDLIGFDKKSDLNMFDISQI